MRQVVWICAVVALALPLAACGSGSSSNDESTGTNPVGGTPTDTSVETPDVERQDGTGTGMNDRELAFASRFFELLNAYRDANGRPAVTWDADIAEAAKVQSDNMKRNGLVSHANPPLCTVPQTCLTERLVAAGVAFVSASEDISQSPRTAEALLESWIISEPNRLHLLGSSWTHVGVGFGEGVSPENATMQGPWWTLVFVQR